MSAKSSFEHKQEIIQSWVNLYTTSLFKWALYKLAEREDAEDLVQDTFVSAYQQLDSFSYKSNPKTWLMAILNHKISDYYRARYKGNAENTIHKAKDNAVYNQFFNNSDRWKKEERPLAWDNDEKHLLDNPKFNQVLKSCFAHLPENWAAAVHLKYIAQKRGEVICQELEISPTNFWQILHRAKLQLRKCLDVNWFKSQ